MSRAEGDLQSVSLLQVGPPDVGHAVEVMAGVLWTRLPLPYAPNHINSYLIRDAEGWFAIECGLDDAACRQAWGTLLSGPLRGQRITGILPTHWHSDHLGLAGWLCKRFSAPLLMSRAEYTGGLKMQREAADAVNDGQRRFLLMHGAEQQTAENWARNGHRYLHMMSPVPREFETLKNDAQLKIGSDTFEVLAMKGHSPEEVGLFSRTRNAFFCADHVPPHMAPSVTVQADDPDGNPLRDYLDSLDFLDSRITRDALILPAHETPYVGLTPRTKALRAYYLKRCAIVAEACSASASSAYDLVTRLYRRFPTDTWIGFVISEIVAYINYLLAAGCLEIADRDPVQRYRAVRTEGRALETRNDKA